jgi:NTP pyrophosphatase (non-canonical NTP hydrolase)
MNQSIGTLSAGNFPQEFSRVNLARCLRWHPQGLSSWSLSDWAVALAGEVGEVCEVIDRSWHGPLDTVALGNELADVYTYLDLFAAAAQLDLHQEDSKALQGKHPGSTWGTITLAMHAGKLCDVVKKLNRYRDGLRGNKDSEAELRQQMGTLVRKIALRTRQLAEAVGLDLEVCVCEKFNYVSERSGFPERIYHANQG